MTKTYEELREETEALNELRVVRAGAAVFYATKVRESGKKLESKINEAKQDFTKAKTQESIAKKIDTMLDGMAALGDGLIAHRQMIGNLTGVAVSSALLSERSNKQLTKLMKGKRGR
jgi:hypothetical protein|tara:strand:+ start:868 stop:1218 length:351 start_codon:yes stop_codon:yes gene_type:complete